MSIQQGSLSPTTPLTEQARLMNLRCARKWETRRRTHFGMPRALQQGKADIERICDPNAAALPEPVSQNAKTLFRRAFDEGLLENRTTETVAVAVVYAATRQANLPYRLCELEAYVRSETPDFSGTFRYIKRELGLELYPPDVGPFVARFADELNVSEPVENWAYDLLQHEDNQATLVGKDPAGLAAGAIYAAALQGNEHLTQDAVTAVANIGEVTLRKRYQELLEPDLEGEIPPA